MSKEFVLSSMIDAAGTDWTVSAKPGQTHVVTTLLNTYADTKALKKDARSRVYLLDHEPHKLVIKFPDAGDKKWNSWLRSIFRYKSYAQRQALSLVKLSDWGHRTPKVVAYGHCRKFGFTTKSFLLMEHLSGHSPATPLSDDHCTQIAAVVQDIHSRGYVHGDPYVQNFMFDSGGKVAAIDALIKKQPFWVVSKINEWFHLDWGARAIPNNAIRMERDRIVKKHPFRYLIYRLFRALKELKKAIFSKT